jgi:uncharacterized membrane protein
VRSPRRWSGRCAASGSATSTGIDPAYGLQQLANVGWTAISSAQQNPQAAQLVVLSLRDILARLTADRGDDLPPPDTDVVYRDDVPNVLMNTLESLAVITADSQQHQIAAALLQVIAGLLDRLPDDYRRRTHDVLLRTLPALASHPPTRQLEDALRELQDVLERDGADEPARLVAEALDNLRQRVAQVPTEYTPR